MLENILDSLVAYIDAYADTPEAKGAKNSTTHHMQRWGISYGLTNMTAQLKNAKTWMINREKWIDEQVAAMEDIYTGMQIARQTEDDCLPDGQARKSIRDRHLYIIKDGHTYSLEGKRIE